MQKFENGNDGVRRRQVLAGALVMGTIGPALAIAPAVAIIVPSLLAGVLAIVGIKYQLDQVERHHAEQMRLSEANLVLAQQQLLSQHQLALRQERVSILTALLGKHEKFAEQYLDRNLALLHSIGVDSDGREANSVLSENADGGGTRIGLVRGRIALERGAYGGVVNNQIAVDLMLPSTEAGDPLPMPVQGMLRDLNRPSSMEYMARFADQQGFASVDAAEQKWSLAGTQGFSRARNPTAAGADLQAALFVPRRTKGVARYSYTRI